MLLEWNPFICRGLTGLYMGFPGGPVVKNSPAEAGAAGSIPASGRSPGRGSDGNPPPGFLPGKSHGQRILVVYSPQGRREADTTY